MADQGKWSQPTGFQGSVIGKVAHYILCTGEQADGTNTGFLVYMRPGNKNIECLIFHSRRDNAPDQKPFRFYGDYLPTHNKTPIPESLRFTHQESKFCEVEWQATDESICRARIGKFPKKGNDDYTGVTDLGCEYNQPGWKSKQSGPHGSTCHKADQWAAAGGFVIMSGSHKFDKRWFRPNKNEHDDPFYLNDENFTLPPRHSREEVMREAKIKQGTFKVRGEGYLLVYARIKGGGSPSVALYDSDTGQRFWPHSNDDTVQKMYQTRNCVFKDGKWDGEWTGQWKGMGNDLDVKRLNGGVPPGQIKTLDVFIEQYWHFREFVAPTEIEYELWFFPREGGGVKIEN